MAYSFVTFPGDGVQTDFTFPFPYLNWEDLTVRVDGLLSPFYFLNASAIRLVTPAPIGSVISIRRVTDKSEPPADFADGSVLLERDLDRVTLFALYTAQETWDLATGVITQGPTAELNAAELLLLLNGKITLSQFALDLANEVALISGSEEVIGTVNWKILQEAQARATALAEGLLAEATARGTAISIERGIRETAEGTIVESIEDLTAVVGGNAVTAHNETQVVADALGVTAGSLSVLAGRVGIAEGAITTETNLRVTERDAYLSRLEDLEAVVVDTYNDTELRGRITDLEEVTVTETEARTLAISSARSDFASADSLLSGRITTAEETAASATLAVANRAAVLESKVNTPAGTTVMSVVAATESTLSTAIGTQAGRVDTLQSSVQSLTDANLISRMGTVEISAATSATLAGAANANYTLKVQARADGKLAVAGIGLNATANTDVAQSEMVFLADKFTFVQSAAYLNETPQALLQLGVSNGFNTLVLAATRVGDQTLSARMLVDGFLVARHITAGTITADKINTEGLTIKQGGVTLFGAGVPLDYSNVGGTKPPANATNGAVIGSNLTGAFTQVSWDDVMTSSYIRNAHIGGDIYSTDYYSSGGTAGWIIKRSGQAVFNDVLVRGDVLANNIVANTIQSYHVQANQITVSGGANTAADVTLASPNGEVTLSSFTLDTAGAPLFITASADWGTPSTAFVTLRIRLNGNIVKSFAANIYSNRVFVVYAPTTLSGANTVSFTAQVSSNYAVFGAGLCPLIAIGLKR